MGDTLQNSNLVDTKLLNAVAAMILTKGDPSNTAEAILDLINKRLPSLFYVYLLIDEGELVLKSYTTQLAPTLENLIKFDVYKIKYPLSQKKPLITKCVNENKIIYSNRLRDFYYPVLKPGVLLDTIQRALGIKLVVGIPIQVQNKVIGAISFGTKNKKLSEEQIEMLELYTKFSGIAIDNSRKYNELKKKYELEKETISLLSHELKTPITIAKNGASLIDFFIKKYKGKDTCDFEELEDLNKDTKNNIERIHKVCESILKLRDIENEVEEMTTTTIRVEDLLLPLVEWHQQKANKKGLHFTYDFRANAKQPKLPIVEIEQIATILLDNAIKYTNKGGYIDVLMEVNAEEFIFTLQDSKPSIPMSLQERVFEKFFQIKLADKAKPDGLGLGLYLAKRLIDRIQGSIELKPDKKYGGNKFVVKVPVRKTEKT